MKTLKIMIGIMSLAIACTLTSGCFLALAGGTGYAVGKHENKKEEEKNTSLTTKTPTNNKKTATSIGSITPTDTRS